MQTNVTIGIHSYLFATHYEIDAKKRAAFNWLSQMVFGIQFEEWYQKGGWTESFRPYTLFDKENAVANVSVCPFELLLDGKPRRYLGLYTVMVHPDWRGLGLSRFLMETILRDWEDQYDQVFLFANDSVLDFYPRFGFEQVQEQAFSRILPTQPGRLIRKLNMACPADRMLLQKQIAAATPLARVSIRNLWGMALFQALYGLEFYVCREPDAVLCIEREKGRITLHDCFCAHPLPLNELARMIPAENGDLLTLGFTPLRSSGWTAAPVQRKDSTTFLLTGRENPFLQQPMLFPTLVHV